MVDRDMECSSYSTVTPCYSNAPYNDILARAIFSNHLSNLPHNYRYSSLPRYIALSRANYRYIE